MGIRWRRTHTWYCEEYSRRIRCNNILYRPYLYRNFSFFFTHIYFPASGPAVVTGVVPSPPRFSPFNFVAQRVQQSHCSSIFHRVLLTRALALSTSQFDLKKSSPRMYTSMHWGGGDRNSRSWRIQGSRIT